MCLGIQMIQSVFCRDQRAEQTFTFHFLSFEVLVINFTMQCEPGRYFYNSSCLTVDKLEIKFGGFD